MFNQAFFAKVLVIQEDDSISGVRLEAELREPFDILLGSDLRTAEATIERAQRPDKSVTGRKGSLRDALRGRHQVNSFSNRLLVDLESHNTNPPRTADGNLPESI